MSKVQVTTEQARAQFAPGLYRHYKGGLYLALALAQDSSDVRKLSVVYRSLQLGELWHRPLAESEDSWTGHVQWPTSPWRSVFPWGHHAPRFHAVHPRSFDVVLLLGAPTGTPLEGLTEFAERLPRTVAAVHYSGLHEVRGTLRSILPDKVVAPLWITHDEPPPDEDSGYLCLTVGDLTNPEGLASAQGQIQGVLAAINPNGPVLETIGRPVTDG